MAEENETDAAPVAMAANQAFDASLSQCLGMIVGNGPKVDKALKVVNYKPVVTINGDVIAIDPTPGACLSSGFGARSG